MSEADREAAEDAYPGSTTAPQSLINVLTSENATETIKAKIPLWDHLGKKTACYNKL